MKLKVEEEEAAVAVFGPLLLLELGVLPLPPLLLVLLAPLAVLVDDNAEDGTGMAVVPSVSGICPPSLLRFFFISCRREMSEP